MTAFTVLGASGFIGSHLVRHLRSFGAEVITPERNAKLAGRSLGHIVYCVGITSDFRSRVLDAVEAHVSVLTHVLRDVSFDSLTYLSSTRLYRYANGSTSECATIAMSPTSIDELYNFSKLLGESITLNTSGQCRVVRLSNVYGADATSNNFLSSIIREAVTTGRIVLRSSLDSAKDYVSVEDVSTAITQVVLRGTQSIYNIAAGRNVTTADICESLRNLTSCSVEVLADAPAIIDPVIDIRAVQSEFSFAPRALLVALPSVVNSLTPRGVRA